ncbi:MAG TPA: hypothetical protein VGR13_02070 [Actinomycetota bacterium]|nr:hypothetical protein [Actinomycetota bacterium]
MKRALSAAGAMATVVSLALIFVGLAARPGLASFVSNNCRPNHAADDHHRRKDALAYAVVAEWEGYEWGGGCWNNNDRDDTPGAPDSNGEGPDCSGLVFKTWELRDPGDNGYTWYGRLENIHGPYATYDYRSPDSADPFVKLPDKSRATTMYMDAFAKNGHVGLLSSRPSPSSNTDYIIEAKGDASGTGEWLESYRYDSNYVAVKRKNWTPDCYPYCQMQARSTMVVVP